MKAAPQENPACPATTNRCNATVSGKGRGLTLEDVKRFIEDRGERKEVKRGKRKAQQGR